jgi:hypothetical protein
LREFRVFYRGELNDRLDPERLQHIYRRDALATDNRQNRLADAKRSEHRI